MKIKVEISGQLRELTLRVTGRTWRQALDLIDLLRSGVAGAGRAGQDLYVQTVCGDLITEGLTADELESLSFEDWRGLNAALVSALVAPQQSDPN
jgi:hypothetical protein